MLALVLAALQALAPVPPSALHRAGDHDVKLRMAESYGRVDWNALESTVTLRGFRERPESTFEHVVGVPFRPTAAAGLETGWLAVAGRQGSYVCIEIWRVEDAVDPSGAPTYNVVERKRVWEGNDADSIGLLVWNPFPPVAAEHSLRALWHQRRELARFDVDRTGWATPTIEAAMRGPTPRGVLQVGEFEGALVRCFLADHPERGLVLMLRTPCRETTTCCTCDRNSMISIAVVDGNRDGRLDLLVRLDLATWDAENWGQLGDYARLFE